MNNTNPILLNKIMNACNQAHFDQWKAMSTYAENEFRSLLLLIDWIGEMRLKNIITIEEARIHIDIQKNTMRTRLMALPQINMLEADHIINTGIDGIRKELYETMEWVII